MNTEGVTGIKIKEGQQTDMEPIDFPFNLKSSDAILTNWCDVREREGLSVNVVMFSVLLVGLEMRQLYCSYHSRGQPSPRDIIQILSDK